MKGMKARILRTYMGVSEGLRDGGWPERRFSAHNTLREAVKMGEDKEVEFFRLTPITKREVTKAKAVERLANRVSKKARLSRKIRDLQKERDDL